MGTRIITPGSGSMKMPNTSSNTFTATKNITGDSFQLTMSSDRLRMPSTVSTHAKAAEVAMTNTEAVSMAERAAIAGSGRPVQRAVDPLAADQGVEHRHHRRLGGREDAEADADDDEHDEQQRRNRLEAIDQYLAAAGAELAQAVVALLHTTS